MAPNPRLIALALVAAIAACGPTTPGTSSSPKPGTSKKPTTSSPGVTLTNGSAIGGRVFARRDTKPGSYRVQLLSDLAVAQAPVFTVDLDAQQTTHPQGKTDGDGKYSVGQLPVDKLVRVSVKIKTPEGVNASLETLAKAGQSLSSDIDLASTMLTFTLVAHAKGGTIPYDAIAYAKAVAAIQGELTAATPPDPAKPDDMISRTEALAKSVKDLNAVVGGPFTGGGATPSASPTTGASPTPTPAPNASPTPSPTPTAPGTSPTPVPTATVGLQDTFQSALKGSSVVPAVTTTATGSVAATLAADRRTLTLDGTVAGLPAGDTVSGAELHYSSDDSLAKVMVLNGTTFRLTWNAADADKPLNQVAVDALEQGKVYVLVKTSAHPTGELRGTLTK
ncbi:MAG: hypothetical protein JWM80_6358 [Cyanobacteria bacterium RYN_339]|nr:hypothetical protein [Cyanobacteria bacterium RYN_339]